MKITVTITKEELNNTEKMIWQDPCTHMQCGQVYCEQCPLREAAADFHKAQEHFINILKNIEVENDET